MWSRRINRAKFAEREDYSASTQPLELSHPIAVFLCVFVVGLLFWISTVLAFVPFNLAASRDIWLAQSSGRWSLFETYVAISLLIATLLALLLWRDCLQARAARLPVLFLYLASASMLGGIGYTLHEMRTTVLDDHQFFVMQQTQGLRSGPSYIGRIRNEAPEDCASVPQPCVLVELSDGSLELATLGPSVTLPATAIVYGYRMVGESTGENRHLLVAGYIEGDLELRWRDVTRHRRD